MPENALRGPRPPAGFERTEYDINGARTVVYTGGSGPPLVYLHGAGSWHGFDFAEPLARTHRFIAPNHPGWGASADPPEELDSMAQYQLHYAELLFDRLGLERFDLIGISMGGWMATEFAVTYPDRIRKLVLCCPAGLPDPAHPGPAAVGTLGLEDMYGFLVSDRSALAAHLPKTDTEKSAHAALVAREMQSAGRLIGATGHGGPFNPRLERWLHRLTMPTLLIWSKDDRLLPFGRHEKWMSLLPNATLLALEGVGHLVLDESAEARSAVAEFLR